MKKSIMILAATLSLATLGACDRAAKNAQEDQSDAARENTEVQTDVVEEKADTTGAKVDGVDSTTENKTEADAKAAREKGEVKADAMKGAADKQADKKDK
jgi:hypothetical protein